VIATIDGVWELARWGRTRDGGPLAAFDDVRGRLIYTADGFVAAQLERASLTEPERRQTYSYSGTWRIDGDTAHHAVDLSTVPEWIGTTLTRTVLVLEASRLHLETPPVRGRSGDLRDVLEWIRPVGARHG
jgi:hypothetical protein